MDVLITTNDGNANLRVLLLKWEGDFYDLASALRKWDHPMRKDLCPLLESPDGWDEKEGEEEVLTDSCLCDMMPLDCPLHKVWEQSS